jgi:hypothetical protein
MQTPQILDLETGYSEKSGRRRTASSPQNSITGHPLLDMLISLSSPTSPNNPHLRERSLKTRSSLSCLSKSSVRTALTPKRERSRPCQVAHVWTVPPIGDASSFGKESRTCP